MKVKLTSVGRLCVFLTFWVLLAAIFTVNNFLFMIFAMTVGFTALAHWLAWRNITDVSVARRFPHDMYASTPFRVDYEITTNRSLWGAGGLTVQERPPLMGYENGMALAHAYPDRPARQSGLFHIEKRGDHVIEPAVVTSSFPFDVGMYTKKPDRAEAILVFPQVAPVGSDIPSWIAEPGRKKERVDPFGGIPYQFRQYVAGDPHKHIDWKKTASVGELITRVLSDEASSEIIIRLSPVAGERAISRAASLVAHFSEKHVPITLQTQGGSIGPGRGPEFARKLLTILARWGTEPAPIHKEPGAGGTVVEIDDEGGFHWSSPNVEHRR